MQIQNIISRNRFVRRIPISCGSDIKFYFKTNFITKISMNGLYKNRFRTEVKNRNLR